MQSLTPQTFAEAMSLCSENSYYKACVVFANRMEMIEFIAALREIGNIPNVRYATTDRTGGGRLEFFNGSVLEIIPCTERDIRGVRCHQLIASGDFDRKCRAYMETMVFPYKATVSPEIQFFDTALFDIRSKKQTSWMSSVNDSVTESTDEVSEELDAFLDSFTVNQSVNKTTL